MLAVVQSERKLGALFRLAIRSGAADAVALHIRRGEPVNGRDGAGFTPLMLGAIHGQLDVCVRLLEAGADHALVSADDRTAHKLAVEHGHAAIAELLFRHACPRPPLVSGPESSLGVPAPRTAPDTSPDEMNGWAADETVVAPRHDPECVVSARDAQRAMSMHRRVSDEMDWSDVELDLPEVHVEATSVSDGEMAAVEELIANGLDAGFVSSASLWSALDADFGPRTDRAHEVLMRLLDDLGILVEPCAQAVHARDLVDKDELDEVIDFLSVELPEPAGSVATYDAQARKVELIKREGEERIGRRMDSALGGLTRALVSLSDTGWQLAFPTDAPADAGELLVEEDEDSPASADQTTEDVVDGDEQIDFSVYVALVRNGMAEYGREEMVPRPRSWELSRLLGIVPGMAPEVASAVVASIAAYEKARDQLVTANLRLAMAVAKGYQYRGLPPEDLIQDANLGLMRAAEKFDFRRGFKFSTYATTWVRQSVLRSLADTVRLIRVPVHMVEKINAVNRARRELEYGLERAVTIEEIAERLSMSPEAVLRVVRSDREVLSLEECGRAGLSGTPDPLCIVDQEADPCSIASRRSLSGLIERMLADCKERERDVLVLRFGLNGLDGMTLGEIGQKLDVTRERIRQIESKALERFRHPSRRDLLLPFAGADCPSDY